MLRKAASALSTAFFLLHAQAASQDRFDPREFRSELIGTETQVFVLASPHLSQAKALNPDWLIPIMDRLAAFKPDAIFVENLSGEELGRLQQYKAIYPEVADQFGASAMRLMGLGQQSLQTDPASAERKVRELLSTSRSQRTPAERRQLAALLATSGDPTSALVQWWQLATDERRAGDGLSQEMVLELQSIASKPNESTWIGSRLAARLGHDRVYPMDDQSATDLLLPRMEEIERAFSADPDVMSAMTSPVLKRSTENIARMTSGAGVTEAYQRENEPSALKESAEVQWATLLRARLPGGFGRLRVAEWEARNLRMAANIREGLGLHPGGRALVIVGSSHKPYLDAYLGLMSDVEVVDPAKVLEQ